MMNLGRLVHTYFVTMCANSLFFDVGSYSCFSVNLNMSCLCKLFFLLQFFPCSILTLCIFKQGGKQCGLSWWKISVPSESDLLSIYQWGLRLLS